MLHIVATVAFALSPGLPPAAWASQLVAERRPAGAPPVYCEEVRRVRGLAVSQGLDDRTLLTLEAQLCGNSAPAVDEPAARRSPRCLDLWMMTTLLEMQPSEAPSAHEVKELRDAVCAMAASRSEKITWNNGVTALSAAGSWSYPSGVTAKSAAGAWSYPSGVTAKSAAGAWAYPSGVTAISVTGQYAMPSGTSASPEQWMLLICKHDAEGCRSYQAGNRALDDDLRTLLLMSRVWRLKDQR